MKFLVVGASGLVGRHVLAYVRSLGYEAVGTEARPRGAGLITFDLMRDRIVDGVGDAFFRTGGPVVVVVTAALSQIDYCARERDLSHAVNVTNTLRLIKDVGARGAHTVFLSSSFVFDGRHGGYTEDEPRSPISEYGRQKAAVEAALEAEAPAALVLRLDKIVSDEPAAHHLYSEWAAAVWARRPIVCIRDQVFAPTFAGDVGRAIVLACTQRLGGRYHVANGEWLSRMDLARRFLTTLGESAEVVSASQEELGFCDLRPLRSSLDSRRFVAATGMRFTPIDEVLRSFSGRASASHGSLTARRLE